MPTVRRGLSQLSFLCALPDAIKILLRWREGKKEQEKKNDALIAALMFAMRRKKRRKKLTLGYI